MADGANHGDCMVTISLHGCHNPIEKWTLITYLRILFKMKKRHYFCKGIQAL
jgi:hypothetical protein